MKIESTKTNLLFALILVIATSVFSQTTAPLSSSEKKLAANVTADEIRRITTELASDKFEGRGMLQRGGDNAARWIAEQMKAIGLKPLGDNGAYLQAGPFTVRELTTGSEFTVGGESFAYGSEWSGYGPLADQSASAPLAFVGHGLVSQPLGRDDLKGFDIKGKIAIIVSGRPSNVSAEQWSPAAMGGVIGGLVQKGARGIVVVGNGLEIVDQDLIVDYLSRRTISPGNTAVQGQPLPLIVLSNEAASRVFKGAPRGFREAVLAAERDDFKPFDLKKEAAVTIKTSSSTGTAYNVIGYLEGSDPALKSEAVVFSAHYDAYGLLHGKIYNGAADNAIGNGEMLAVAKAFSEMNPRPKRSLIFISCMAEESGLLGSRYWAANPTWDITKVAANLNLDGIGTEIMGPVKRMIGFGAKYSTLGNDFESLMSAYGIGPMEDPIPEQGVFMRSDHYAFVERGIPALMLVGSPEETPAGFRTVFEEFENTKYHMPTDDVYDDWYWPGAKTVADIMAIIGLRIAQSQELPSWKPGNEFSNLKRGDKYSAGN